ncbi:MAG: late competence development ComFB family protein, partial [Firmicutes bacterium]|nr:late competence development ComFB family protein [Bacillota bacterium]
PDSFNASEQNLPVSSQDSSDTQISENSTSINDMEHNIQADSQTFDVSQFTEDFSPDSFNASEQKLPVSSQDLSVSQVSENSVPESFNNLEQNIPASSPDLTDSQNLWDSFNNPNTSLNLNASQDMNESFSSENPENFDSSLNFNDYFNSMHLDEFSGMQSFSNKTDVSEPYIAENPADTDDETYNDMNTTQHIPLNELETEINENTAQKIRDLLLKGESEAEKKQNTPNKSELQNLILSDVDDNDPLADKLRESLEVYVQNDASLYQEKKESQIIIEGDNEDMNKKKDNLPYSISSMGNEFKTEQLDSIESDLSKAASSDENSFPVNENNKNNDDYVFVNVAEELVRSKVTSLMQSNNMCTCSRCTNDVVALTLNKVPPKYVVTHKGILYARINACLPQYQTDLVTAISEACLTVKNHARHTEKNE